jgi:hypothetical protein
MGVEVKVKITIRGKNAQVTDALKGYVEKRLTKLTRYFDSIQEALFGSVWILWAELPFLPQQTDVAYLWPPHIFFSIIPCKT